MELKSCMKGFVPYAAMVMVECADVGLTTLSKAAMSKGMSHFIFVVYSNALATLIIFPVYNFLRTERSLPSFAPLEILSPQLYRNCVFTGVIYSSPTLASAMSNLVPAFTFLLAVIFRMEKLDSRSSRNQINYSIQTNWVLGGIFLATASLCLSLWNTFQCAMVAFIAERNYPKAWLLRHNIEPVSVIYSAVFGNVVTFCVETWCIYKKGPVFVAMFKPLGIAIAALLGVIILGDRLHVGSVIGAVVIVIGFYGVIWAQAKEQEKGDFCEEHDPDPASSSQHPLLH
ncbi:WAT1-related protein [Abeliophyllum distichum]|uniref:WAT1-related protein n=1 Tax=Abeliophyllum distichum TaxID=126358 RepID=A0ABD1RWE5_9LAMI